MIQIKPIVIHATLNETIFVEIMGYVLEGKQDILLDYPAIIKNCKSFFVWNVREAVHILYPGKKITGLSVEINKSKYLWNEITLPTLLKFYNNRKSVIKN